MDQTEPLSEFWIQLHPENHRMRILNVTDAHHPTWPLLTYNIIQVKLPIASDIFTFKAGL